MPYIVDAPGVVVFSIFYFLFVLGFVYETREARGLGVAPENILVAAGIIKDEETHFLQYHLRRTSGTVFLRSLLPLVYLLVYSYISANVDGNYEDFFHFWQQNTLMLQILKLSVGCVVLAASVVWYWSLNDNRQHAIMHKLIAYAQTNVQSLIDDINQEFRRIDKVCVEMNSRTHLIITDNWIITLGPTPHSFFICHQSDASFNILDSDCHSLSPEGDVGGAQYLKIQVENRKPGVEGFQLRVNSLEYQNIQSKLENQIQNVRNIEISKSVSDRFVDVFKAEVEQNPKVTVSDDLEPCIGCMVNQANVKLIRVCGSTGDETNGCVNCYCRPMWCLTCLAKWFASRQNESEPETWLGSKCPCPTCRMRFCVLDVSLIDLP